MTRYVPPDFTEAQVRTLRVLADGLWHDSRRASGADRVLGTVAAELYRRGYLERQGESRTARPSNPGFRYRLNQAGQRAVVAVDEARRVTASAYRGGMSFTASLSGHFGDTAKNDQALAIVREAAAQLDALRDVDGGDSFYGSFSGPDQSASFPEAPAPVANPDLADGGAVELADGDQIPGGGNATGEGEAPA